ncbi:Intradiol ring-cleavage dioxygenase [Microdochium trichocladiopsis]|uniref:Intradiol ring-cleavage dioxygenase n=1 Tax=Microdochium trichocladiopsis TaxID=1682393 RepID=A0A9P9BU67_9PEZI|nr:Intradiol ring-cleavage dioxygenase [Microdochium trichocladiopsis]KAH7037782.1 Intradiol ring-cleavage dioxygenase [Microdochium trichocladiopsis]
MSPKKHGNDDTGGSVHGGNKLAYDQNFTPQVVAATGPQAHPRMAEIMPSLLRHLHDFAREVNLTAAEWTAAVDFINAAGKMSDNTRNETALICDILGLESLVDEITSKLLIQGANAGATPATPSTVLGPFYRTDAPILPNGSSIVSADAFKLWNGKGDDMTCFVSGRVLSASTGNPVSSAMVDIWLAGPDGLYEQQSAEVPDMNLRGRFQTDADGRYSIYCLRPTPYGIPDDGPGGALLKLLDRHHWRPAHIHFIVSAEGHNTLTTQVFDREGEWVKNDSVFAVKDELLVDFRAREDDDKAKWTLEYDFVLPEV